MQHLPGNLGLNLANDGLRPRQNAHVRNTLPYDENSAWVRDAKLFLQRLRVVRMKQDTCGGSGHYAAGRAALDSLIRLGFSGSVEVLHDLSPDSQTNMPRCYEGFAPGGSSIEVTGPAGNRVRITYEALPGIHAMGQYAGMTETRRLCGLRPAASLGLFGASDGFGMDGDALPLHPHADERPAARLNTRCSIVLQPFGWGMMKMIEDSASNWRQAILRLRDAPVASYIMEIPNLVTRLPPYQRNRPQVARIFREYVAANAGGLNGTVQSTVAAVLSKAACGDCHLMPLYGLHANTPGDWTLNLFVRAVRDLRTLGVLDGPVVLFNILGRYDTDGESNGLCTPLRADHMATAQAITQAADGIFVVRAPGLPTALFHQMAANATLPMLLEGANTAALCLQLGTPFFATSNNASIPEIDEGGRRGRAALVSLTRFVWGANRASDEQVAEIVAAIMDSVTPGSDLFRFLRRAHELSRAPDGDQLAVALALLERRIQARGPALALPPDPPPAPLHLVLRLRPPEPERPRVYKCPTCRNFASMGPGTCWKCGVPLRPE
jgi:hypothetical protein